MAEQNKPHDSHDPKGKEPEGKDPEGKGREGKDQDDRAFDMNLELPQHRVPDESEIDFNDAEDVQVVDAADTTDVHGEEQPKSGKLPKGGPRGDVNLVMADVVEAVVEVVDDGD